MKFDHLLVLVNELHDNDNDDDSYIDHHTITDRAHIVAG